MFKSDKAAALVPIGLVLAVVVAFGVYFYPRPTGRSIACEGGYLYNLPSHDIILEKDVKLGFYMPKRC